MVLLDIFRVQGWHVYVADNTICLVLGIVFLYGMG